MHKWHLNILSLQSSNKGLEVKLHMPKKNLKTQPILKKILRVPYNKNLDNLFAVVHEPNEKLITNTNVLSYITSIYDSLGLISSSHIIAQSIYLLIFFYLYIYFVLIFYKC